MVGGFVAVLKKSPLQMRLRKNRGNGAEDSRAGAETTKIDAW